jgi:hypothetical protein
MNFDITKFKEDASKSNPMVVAIVHPDCPHPEKQEKMCMGLTVGFGTPAFTCEFFRQDSIDSASCTFDEKPT